MANQVVNAVNGLDGLQVNGVLEWGGVAHHRALCEAATWCNHSLVLSGGDGCLVLRDGCLVPRDGCLVLRDGCLVLRDGVWCRVMGVWCCVMGVWCCVVGVWCCVMGVWCCVMVSGPSRSTRHHAPPDIMLFVNPPDIWHSTLPTASRASCAVSMAARRRCAALTRLVQYTVKLDTFCA